MRARRGGAGQHVGTLGWEELPGEVDVPDVPVTGTMPGRLTWRAFAEDPKFLETRYLAVDW